MNNNLLDNKRKQRLIIKHLKRWKVYLASIIFLSIFGYIVVQGTMVFVRQLLNTRAYAPTHRVYASTEEPEQSEHDQIVAYINEVFGDDADKAFKLLSCENASLNPNAVNTAGNTPAGSRDTGVFQINEYWQKVQYKFLLNWRVNVEIAHQLYRENGDSFKLWSCAKKVGLN